MKKRVTFVAACACMLGALCLALVGCGGSGASGDATTAGTAEEASIQLVKDGTLTCVSELGFAPFEYIEPGSTDPVGYDIDVANEIAKRLNLECEFLPTQDFDSLIPTIKEGGKADIAIAAITITADREKEVDFSDPYFESNLALVVKKDSGLTAADLDNKESKVACQTGTSSDSWISENLPSATKVTLADPTAALAGVSTGSYVAVVIDLPVAQKNLRDSFTDLEIVEEIPTGEQYGIAISKDNPALKDAINKALADMEEDGTMQSIWDEWIVSAAGEE